MSGQRLHATNHVCVYILICALNKFMKSSSCMALDHACHAGKYDCQYSTFSCQAPMEGMRGQVILEVQRQPYNGGKACLDPLVEKECTAPVHCSGIWEKYNCSQRCTTGLTTAYWNHVFRTTQRPKMAAMRRPTVVGIRMGTSKPTHGNRAPTTFQTVPVMAPGQPPAHAQAHVMHPRTRMVSLSQVARPAPSATQSIAAVRACRDSHALHMVTHRTSPAH